jgi:hypothetical protein
MCHNEIALCAQNIDTILGSIVNNNWEEHVESDDCQSDPTSIVSMELGLPTIEPHA